MLWFRGGSSRRSMSFHFLNCINMHGYGVSKTRPSVGGFTKYLWFLFLSLAALKGHRSAIATIVDPLSLTLLSQHHMVRKFVEAFFLSRPPHMIVKFIWSIAAVLDMLKECGAVRDLGRPKFSLGAMFHLLW